MQSIRSFENAPTSATSAAFGSTHHPTMSNTPIVQHGELHKAAAQGKRNMGETEASGDAHLLLSMSGREMQSHKKARNVKIEAGRHATPPPLENCQTSMLFRALPMTATTTTTTYEGLFSREASVRGVALMRQPSPLAPHVSQVGRSAHCLPTMSANNLHELYSQRQRLLNFAASTQATSAPSTTPSTTVSGHATISSTQVYSHTTWPEETSLQRSSSEGSSNFSTGHNHLTGVLPTVNQSLSLQQIQYLRSHAILRLKVQRQAAAVAEAAARMAHNTAAYSTPSAAPSGGVPSHLPAEVSAIAAATGRSPRIFGRLARLGMATSSNCQVPLCLPAVIAQPIDSLILSEHQAFLREQIEIFEATEDDLGANVRGRNKPIQLGQVGIRCRHCAHIPASRRQKGSVYFPAALLGLYQAAQNMSTNHIQCGLCLAMPDGLKSKFTELIPTKNTSSGAGRTYWAESAKTMGLVDTEEHGIRFSRTYTAPTTTPV